MANPDPSADPSPVSDAAEPSYQEALALLAIQDRLDHTIERCRRERLPLASAMCAILSAAVELLGAQGAVVRALDERLDWTTYRHGRFEASWEAHLPGELPRDPELGAVLDALVVVEGAVIGERLLECAHQSVGWLALSFDEHAAARWEQNLRRELRMVAEQLDNYLEHVAASARKHKLAVSASQALRSAILEEGCDAAVRVLSTSLGLAGVLLVYGDLDHRRRSIHYRRYQAGEVVADSLENPDPQVGALLRSGVDLLDPEDSSLHELLDGQGAVETQLVNGLTAAPIGKLVVSRQMHGLDPEAHDILHLFAECLSQRLVDYNRERRVLAAAFSPADAGRLLRVRNKYQRYLAPREETIGMLFVDVCSFTAMCERVLANATEIGAFVDRWSEGAVEILFANHGVFDKMVGDCVIGLFGPPFFESSLTQRAADATRAGLAIAAFTAELGREHGLTERLVAAGVGPGLGVAVGLNVGRASVGFFGPHNDYTGFSQSMNNAARLQGVAGFQEVLVSKSTADLLVGADLLAGAEAIALEGPFEAKVKNVADPLVYFRASAAPQE